MVMQCGRALRVVAGCAFVATLLGAAARAEATPVRSIGDFSYDSDLFGLGVFGPGFEISDTDSLGGVFQSVELQLFDNSATEVFDAWLTPQTGSPSLFAVTAAGAPGTFTPPSPAGSLNPTDGADTSPLSPLGAPSSYTIPDTFASAQLNFTFSLPGTLSFSINGTSQQGLPTIDGIDTTTTQSFDAAIDFTPAATTVPEPSTLCLVAAGGLIARRRRPRASACGDACETSPASSARILAE